MMEQYVTLRPRTHPETGYDAVLIEEYDDPDIMMAPDAEIIRVWPRGIIDAELVARTAAIRWAAKIGAAYRD